MTWSAQQYTRFEDERTRPVLDLVAAIPNTTIERAVDLGCGPGNSTAVLQQRYPAAQIEGIDNDADMLQAARQRLPHIQFTHADIGAWRSDVPLDVILADASLQWLPDHARLYPRLMQQLQHGGTLAIQTPDNLQEPAHVMAREIASRGTWEAAIGDVQLPQRHNITWYYALLKPSTTRLDVWRTTYMHPLANHQAVVEWFKGSGLRPYLAQLTPEQQEEFLADYLEAIQSAYPSLPDGTVLLPFPRLFIVATR